MYVYQVGEKVLVMTGEPDPQDPQCTKLHGKFGRVVGYCGHPMALTLVEFDEPIVSVIYNHAMGFKKMMNAKEYYSSKVVPIMNSCLRLAF